MTDVAPALRAIIAHYDIAKAWDAAALGGSPVTTPLEAFSRPAGHQLIQQWSHDPVDRLGFEAYLSGVTANPSDPARTRLIQEYCVLQTATPATDHGIPILNASSAALTSAVNTWTRHARFLVDAFRATRLLPKQEPSDAPRLAIVAGDRGVGKTFLQNYIVSVFTPMFDDAKVLWIRLNLVRDGGPEWQLDHWIKAQLTKVLARYYDPRSRVCRKAATCKLLVNMDDVLAPILESSVDVQRERAATMLRILRMEAAAVDRDIDATWIPADIADTVFNFVVEHGIGLIVVLDGLDLLGTTPALKRLFRKRLEAVAAYLRSDAPLWRYHLLFIREESTWDVQTAIRQPLAIAADQNRQIVDYLVGPVDLETLLERRLETLESEVTRTELGGYSGEDVRRFREYLAATDSGVIDDNGRPLTYVTVLRMVLGSNARSAMQWLHTAVYEFVRERGHQGHQYLLTDRLMRLGGALPPLPPVYRRAGDGGPARLERHQAGSGHAVYDAVFLPSIIRFPCEQGALASAELHGKAKGQLLMGLRALQLAAVIERHEVDIERLDEDSLIVHMVELFNYDIVPVRAMVDDLIDAEVLQPTPMPRAFAVDAGMRPLRVTPKGRQILDRYVFDPAYLNVAAFTLPIPANLAGSWLSVVALPAHVHDIVVGKIQNAVVLSRLLVECSEEQRREVDRRRKTLTQKTAAVLSRAEGSVTGAHGGLFSFEAKLRASVLEIGERILSGLSPAALNRVLNNFKQRGVLRP